MNELELYNIDPEDISDVLVKVETSFNIKFKKNELAQITTFGQLCDHITNKIQLSHTEECTTQQAFYKLREALAAALQIDKQTILADTALAGLLPRKNRRSIIKKTEQHLGFKLNLLRPAHWLSGTLAVLFLASLVALFFNWQIGLFGLAGTAAALWLAHKTGKEIDLQTVGELAEIVIRENYMKVRRNQTTVNKTEIEKVLTDLFSNDLSLDKSKLTREAKFVKR
jgi:hypothetical protein